MGPSRIAPHIKFIKDIERKYAIVHSWLPKKRYDKNFYLLKKHNDVSNLRLDYLNLIFESKSNIKEYFKISKLKKETKDEVEKPYYENHIDQIIYSLKNSTSDLEKKLESLVCENNLYRAMEIIENHVAPEKPTEW